MDNVMGCIGTAPSIIELDTRDPMASRLIWTYCVVAVLIVLFLAQGAVMLPPPTASVVISVDPGYPEGIAAWLSANPAVRVVSAARRVRQRVTRTRRCRIRDAPFDHPASPPIGATGISMRRLQVSR